MVDLQGKRGKYRRMFDDALSSPEAWTDGPIVEFTEDLCRLMKEKNVSRSELAKRIGTSRAYVTKLLGGNANFTLATMVKLAFALDGAVHVHIADKQAVTHWTDEVRGHEPKSEKETT
ncbi:MAG TPA: helix-turn-helix transcriptional regulator [Thermoanaerobaculia bacterium]|nr:helix-turn-helix transcriptional regulator [Thermoanaerobaculia bacterium]